MGINLLWKFIKDHKQEVVTNVDLVERAKTCHESKMNVMIDFYNFQFYLKDKFTRSLSQITDNSQLMFAAGEYKLMDKALRCFIEEFRNVNVEPVFYLDAARGSGAEQVEPKLPLWRRRYFSYLGNMNKVFQFLNGKIPITEVKLDLLARPCLQEIQNIHTLQELKCQMVFNES
uniref:Uncharacterized protein n=1 Tax=Biomphalaria glabrata TaxID=6526 RepID=A0A2C9L1J3_BIOGL